MVRAAVIGKTQRRTEHLLREDRQVSGLRHSLSQCHQRIFLEFINPVMSLSCLNPQQLHTDCPEGHSHLSATPVSTLLPHSLYNLTASDCLSPNLAHVAYQLCDPWQVANLSAAKFP